MFTKLSLTLIIPILVIVSVILGAGMSYMAAKKGLTFPTKELSSLPPDVDQQPLPTSRFYVGEITAPSRDEDLHYIKLEVEVAFQGNLAKTLDERKYEIKEKISQYLSRLTILRAKEDYPDGFMQKGIERELNGLLKTEERLDRISKVTIATFMIN